MINLYFNSFLQFYSSRNQNEILVTTKDVLKWAISCYNEVLTNSGVAPIPSYPVFETIPETLWYMRDQIDAAIDCLQKVNESLKTELKQKNESMIAAHKKQAKLEAELVVSIPRILKPK